MDALLFLSYKKLKNVLLQFLKPKCMITILIYFLFTVSFLIYPGESTKINVSNELYVTGCWFLYGLISSILVFNILFFGVTKFTQSDADYLINSPIDPQHIFLYGCLQKYKKTIGVLFLIFICFGCSLENVTTITINVYLKTILILVWLLFIMFVFVLQVLKYTKKHSKTILWIFTSFYFGLTIIAPLVDLFHPIGFEKWREYIPLCGWAIKILNTLFSLKINHVVFAYLVMVVSCLICLFMLMKQDSSCFYDCFLESSASAKITRFHNKDNKKVYGFGVTALIGKDRIEILRKDKFPFVDIGTLIISIFVFVLGVGLSQSSTEQGEPLSPVLVLFVSLLFLALFSVLCFNVDTMKSELKNIYIHLIPETAFKKIIALTIMPCIRHFTVAFVLILVLSIILNTSVLLIVYTSMLYFSITLLLMAINVLFIRFFGSDIDEALGLWVYLKLVFGFIAMLPALFVFVMFLILFDNIVFSFMVTTVINMLLYLMICRCCKLLVA